MKYDLIQIYTIFWIIVYIYAAITSKKHDMVSFIIIAGLLMPFVFRIFYIW